MGSKENFTKALSSKGNFYSLLTGKGISDDDYGHAVKVLNKFGMKTMKDYYNLYLECDALLLADAFENLEVGT